MPYNLTYKIKNGNKKDFFHQIGKKKSQSLITLVLLKVWGKTLV